MIPIGMELRWRQVFIHRLDWRKVKIRCMRYLPSIQRNRSALGSEDLNLIARRHYTSIGKKSIICSVGPIRLSIRSNNQTKDPVSLFPPLHISCLIHWRLKTKEFAVILELFKPIRPPKVNAILDCINQSSLFDNHIFHRWNNE